MPDLIFNPVSSFFETGFFVSNSFRLTNEYSIALALFYALGYILLTNCNSTNENVSRHFVDPLKLESYPYRQVANLPAGRQVSDWLRRFEERAG